MVFGRRVSAEIAEQFAADKKLAAIYPDRLAAVTEAERELRHAQAAGASFDEQTALSKRLESAMAEAIEAAEAAERVAMGPGTYGVSRESEIARRKARAKAAVRPYSEELDRLRTAREAHKLSFRASVRV